MVKEEDIKRKSMFGVSPELPKFERENTDKEEICQTCSHANVCIYYNDVHKAVSPFEDDAKKPCIKAKIFECSFWERA